MVDVHDSVEVCEPDICNVLSATHVRPVGIVLSVRVTTPVKPNLFVREIVEDVVVVPSATVATELVAETEKSGVGIVNWNVALAV